MNRRFNAKHAFILLVVAGVIRVMWPLVLPNRTQQITRVAGRALSSEKWSLALQLAKEALSINPDDAHFQAVAGIASARLHDVDAAVGYLSQESHTTPLAPMEIGMQFLKCGHLRDAERSFRDALRLDPTLLEAHRQLALLLSFQGRCAEASPHLIAEVQSGEFRSDQLCLLGIPDRIVRRDETLRDLCERHAPDDPLHRLGEARILLADHHVERAETIVKEIVARYPDLALAQSLMGRILIDKSQHDKLVAWHRSLPTQVADDADIWFVRSLWARRSNQTSATIRCLLEVLKSRPAHIEANYQLSQSFRQLGDDEQAMRFSERSLLLSKLGYVINDLRGNPNSNLLRQAAEALEELGHGWEAIGWCQMARSWGPGDWVTPMFDRLRPQVSRESSRVFTNAHPLKGIRVEDYPVPGWDSIPADPAQQQPNSRLTDIRFRNAAPETGLDFQYFNSMNPEVGLEHIFQTTGGGAAAIDVDGDSWPDLYFSNGRKLPESADGLNERQTEHCNALYRNRHGVRFERIENVAMQAGDGFGQGVTSGDFDNDGFPDLYVGNAGRNRLYHNNGDGTFTVVTSQSGTAGDSWTMSAMIADVDEDGLSDIYAVNYLNMDEVFERSCKRNGQPLTCAPTLFSAAQDRLYRNLGNGTFQDVTEEWGISHLNGKGLGIVGFSSTERPGLQIFVANDTTENLFFQTVNDSHHFRENAVLAGLAMSESGTMQACMGVAAGDADGDGAMDLFVTNFYADSNTMYLQTAPGLFADATRNLGLAQSSYSMVGFGTQFLDADLDGQLDLIVTNGHVDQTFATGEPDRMTPQFYHNTGGGQFIERKSDSLGEPFRQKRFGRALTRLDWNRDLRNDACIVNLNDPVSLVTNSTLTDNHSLMLTLKGTINSRDAIGAVVRLETTRTVYTRQLTGGDGYQASNERLLNFGFPGDEQPLSLSVQWATGVDTFHTVPVGHAIIVQNGGLFTIDEE